MQIQQLRHNRACHACIVCASTCTDKLSHYDIPTQALRTKEESEYKLAALQEKLAHIEAAQQDPTWAEHARASSPNERQDSSMSKKQVLVARANNNGVFVTGPCAFICRSFGFWRQFMTLAKTPGMRMPTDHLHLCDALLRAKRFCSFSLMGMDRQCMRARMRCRSWLVTSDKLLKRTCVTSDKLLKRTCVTSDKLLKRTCVTSDKLLKRTCVTSDKFFRRSCLSLRTQISRHAAQYSWHMLICRTRAGLRQSYGAPWPCWKRGAGSWKMPGPS
jgi:hypothetical protein